MARTTKAAADKAAVTAADATEAKTPATTPKSEDNAAVSDSAMQASEAAEVDVVVRPKRIIRHEGADYSHPEKVALPRADAERLKRIGFVDYLSDLRAAAQAADGVSIAVSDGVQVKQG